MVVFGVPGSPFRYKVSSVQEVDKLAPRPSDGEALPGFELEGVGDGVCLTVSVDLGEWALVWTRVDPEFEQWATIGDAEREGAVDVMWDEVTFTPKRWFIDQALALEAVGIWLRDRTRSSTVDWTDDTSR